MRLIKVFEHVFVDTLGPMDATTIKAKISPVNHSKNLELTLSDGKFKTKQSSQKDIVG
jgi:hypothetical protein